MKRNERRRNMQRKSICYNERESNEIVKAMAMRSEMISAENNQGQCERISIRL
jgi:hypothetical protein